MAKPKAVRVLGMELKPRARCLGQLDAQGNIKTPCNWFRDHGDDTREKAKLHATFTTHTVRVIREAFDDYRKDGE